MSAPGRRCHKAAAAVAAALAVTAPAGLAAAAEPCAEGLCEPEALAPFFRALHETETGARRTPVHILQIGDSHSAADHITGALRARLQSRFGEGGRGALPPGRPFKAYAPRQIELEQSDGWRLEASFLPSNWLAPGKPVDPAQGVPAAGPFGLSGWRLVSTRSGASLNLKADPEARFDRAVVCAMAGPNAGAVVLAAGETRRRMPLAAATTQPVCRSFAYDAPQSRLELTTEGGAVTLLSFATFREEPGVAVSNLGVIGTRIQDFALRDDAIIAAELKAYAPDLIVLAYGTNEGFQAGGVDTATYEAITREQIRRLKRLAPGVPVLLLGAPDAATVRPDIPEDGVHNAGFTCAPLSGEEVADYTRLVADKSPRLARWYAPPALAVVRDAQRRAAVEEGAAFWDWQARMGGACSAHRLSQAEPRLVRGDHIHFTSEGGARVAELLSGDLLSAYAALTGKK